MDGAQLPGASCTRQIHSGHQGKPAYANGKRHRPVWPQPRKNYADLSRCPAMRLRCLADQQKPDGIVAVLLRPRHHFFVYRRNTAPCVETPAAPQPHAAANLSDSSQHWTTADELDRAPVHKWRARAIRLRHLQTVQRWLTPNLSDRANLLTPIRSPADVLLR